MAAEALTVIDTVEALGHALLARRAHVACAESCTGGLVCAALTELAGSSGWFERGWVTYSNAAKTALLGVPETLLTTQGAVSEACALAMVDGALGGSDADFALSVTGIAGPGGAVPGKPVGTVCFAWGRRRGRRHSDTQQFAGDRQAVRAQSVQHSLETLLRFVAAEGV